MRSCRFAVQIDLLDQLQVRRRPESHSTSQTFLQMLRSPLQIRQGIIGIHTKYKQLEEFEDAMR